MKYLAIIALFFCGVANADTITLNCNEHGCPEVINGESYQGFQILTMPQILSYSSQRGGDFTEFLGNGGVFSYNGNDFDFGDGKLECVAGCGMIGELYTDNLRIDYDSIFGETIIFDPPSESPEPSAFLLLGTGIVFVILKRS